jgi:hypothetical protein
MVTRPNPFAANTANAASSSRARVCARRRVTRAGDRSAGSIRPSSHSIRECIEYIHVSKGLEVPKGSNVAGDQMEQSFD